MQAVNFYSFYVYRTALSNLLGSANLNAGGTDRFLAGARAGEPPPPPPTPPHPNLQLSHRGLTYSSIRMGRSAIKPNMT